MTPSPAERIHQILDLERQARFARETELKKEIALLRTQLITLDHQLMAVAKGDPLHEEAPATLHTIAAKLARLQDELSAVRAQVGAMCLLADYQEQRDRAERAEALLQECRDEWWLPPEMTTRIDALLKKEEVAS